MNILGATYNKCSLRNLRWALLSQKRKEGHQLPPTLGKIIPNVHRVFYMARILEFSQKPCLQSPSPTQYYWELLDGKPLPVS